MNIISRLNKTNLCFIFFCCLLTFEAQNISPTNSVSNCGICAPEGWQIISGTPDVSDRNIASIPGGSLESGTAWDNAPLPLPVNNHIYWLSLRDVTNSFPEEIVGTTITNLNIDTTYEVVFYSMTTKATDNPGYSPQYNDYFRYKIGNYPIVDITPISQDVWETTKFSFVATSQNMNLEFYPGNNAVDLSNMESVQISVSINAINAVPVADDNSASTFLNTPVSFIVTNTDFDPDGNIDTSTVDLDPTTDAFDNNITTNEGHWSVDTLGNVTFTPVNGFLGIAEIYYTVNDDYDLDGVNQSATSNEALLTVLIVDPCDAVVSGNLDTDNDGISDICDTEECDGLDNNGDGNIDEGFDSDEDSIADCFDNCPDFYNPEQLLDGDCDGKITTEDCDDLDPTVQECLHIYQGFSPNDDGKNDVFVIEGIHSFPNNEFKVFNRWGTIVYEAKSYKNQWDGTTNKNVVLTSRGVLPTGVYFFVLELNNDEQRTEVGWLYLNR